MALERKTLMQEESCDCLPQDPACACGRPDGEHTAAPQERSVVIMPAASGRDAQSKTDLARRLSRAEGQIRGIKAMVERDEYCGDILNQLAAARAALKSISLIVMQGHVQKCLVRKVRNDDTEIIDELIATIGKMM